MKGRIRISIACTGLLLVAAPSARAQTTYRETGSVTVGGYLLWVRGTNAKVVELFVGRGFRNAFAKAHDIDRRDCNSGSIACERSIPVTVDDSSSADAQLRGTALGEDVTVNAARGRVVLWASTARERRGADQDGGAHGARLHRHARLGGSRDACAVGAAADNHGQHADAGRGCTRAGALAPALAPALARAIDSIPVSTMGPSTASAPPELVLPTPNERVAPVGYAPELSALPTPSIVLPTRAVPVMQLAAAQSEAPAVAAPVVTPPPVVTAPVVAPVVTTAPDSVPSHDDVPSDKLIHTPLGPFTIPGALLSRSDKEAQYCYTQLGLKYSPDLKGEITVRLSLRTDGAVEDAVVTKRSWQGISAGEVESCVRALAHDWTFAPNDPSVADGAKSLTFSFAP